MFELEGSPCIRRICWLTTAVHWDSGMLTAQAGIAEGGKVKPDMAALTWSQSTDSSVDWGEGAEYKRSTSWTSLRRRAYAKMPHLWVWRRNIYHWSRLSIICEPSKNTKSTLFKLYKLVHLDWTIYSPENSLFSTSTNIKKGQRASNIIPTNNRFIKFVYLVGLYIKFWRLVGQSP